MDDSRLLGIVHNAGFALSGPVELVPIEGVRDDYETNVFGVISLTQALLPTLRLSRNTHHSSRIVIVSSSLGSSTIAGGSIYSSTKHAIEAIGDGLRMELAPWKIDVTMVEPGSHATPFHPAADAKWEKVIEAARKNPYCGQEVLQKYVECGEKAYTPPPDPSKQPIEVVVDGIVTGLLATYPPARVKCGLDSAMGGILWFFPAFMTDRFMGKGYF